MSPARVERAPQPQRVGVDAVWRVGDRVGVGAVEDDACRVARRRGSCRVRSARVPGETATTLPSTSATIVLRARAPTAHDARCRALCRPRTRRSSSACPGHDGERASHQRAARPPRASQPASTPVSASGIGAAWRPATPSTATASTSVPPAPPDASGTPIHGRPIVGGGVPHRGAQPSRSAACTASCVQVSAKRRDRGVEQQRVGGHRRPLAITPRRISLVPPRIVHDGATSTRPREQTLEGRRRRRGTARRRPASAAAP